MSAIAEMAIAYPGLNIQGMIQKLSVLVSPLLLVGSTGSIGF